MLRSRSGLVDLPDLGDSSLKNDQSTGVDLFHFPHIVERLSYLPGDICIFEAGLNKKDAALIAQLVLGLRDIEKPGSDIDVLLKRLWLQLGGFLECIGHSSRQQIILRILSEPLNDALFFQLGWVKLHNATLFDIETIV